MSKAYQKILSQAKTLNPQEQLALIAALSKWLSKQKLQALDEVKSFEGMLPDEDEAVLLKRVESYEKGESQTISGKEFREELRKKYDA